MSDLKTALATALRRHQWGGDFLGCGCGWKWPEERTHFCGEDERIAKAHAEHVADAVNTVAMFDANRILEITQMRGMIWWLASDLAADDPDSTPETWVALAEKYWQLGLRSETRFLNLGASDGGCPCLTSQ